MDTRELTITESTPEDLEILGLFPQLQTVDASRCPDLEQLAQLKIRYGSIMQGIKEENGQLLQTLQRLRCIADHQDIPAMLSETARINDYYNRLSSRDQANF